MNHGFFFYEGASAEERFAIIPSELYGCVFLGESKNGFVISDHSDRGASKEPTNLCLEWIRRFL